MMSAHSFSSFGSYFAPRAARSALGKSMSVSTGIALVLVSATCLVEASLRFDMYVLGKARPQAIISRHLDAGEARMAGAIDLHNAAVLRVVAVQRIHEIQPPTSMMRASDASRTVLARAEGAN